MPKIINIQSDVIEVSFDTKLPPIGTILKTSGKSSFMVDKIINNKTVAAIVMDLKETIKLGDSIENTNKGLTAPYGPNIFGNVFNVMGEIIGKYKGDKIPKKEVVNNQEKDYTTDMTFLQTGIKAIDFLSPIFKGNKLGVFGGAGVGKTVVIKEIIFNTSKTIKNSSSIFVGIGERSREGEELYTELEESKLLNKTTLFFAGMNEFAGARFNIIKTALITAEHMRDVEKKDVVMFVDNIFRFVQAGSEIASSLGKRPSSVGYQSTLLSEVSEVEERILANKNGAITSFQSVYVPADDITDPAAVAIFSHLDGSIVLDRKVAGENLYPAISITETNSSNTTIDKIGTRHHSALTLVKNIIKKADELEDIISILGIEELSQEDQDIVILARQIKYYFTQNFSVAEQFTQKHGSYVPLEQTISELERILNKEFIDVEPSKFLYIDNLNDIDISETITIESEENKK